MFVLICRCHQMPFSFSESNFLKRANFLAITCRSFVFSFIHFCLGFRCFHHYYFSSSVFRLQTLLADLRIEDAYSYVKSISH